MCQSVIKICFEKIKPYKILKTMSCWNNIFKKRKEKVLLMIKGFAKLFKIYQIGQLGYKLFKISINGSKQVITSKNW